MVKFLTSKTLDYLLRHNGGISDSTNEYEWLRYGIEIIYSSLIATVVILVISLVMNSLVSGLLFFVVFVTTRQYTGGFHANTYLKCNIVSALSYTALIVLCKSTHVFFNLKYSVVIAFFEVLIALIIFPVQNRNKPIRTHLQYKMCKIIGVVVFALYNILGIYISIYNTEYGVTIQYTLHMIVILGIIGHFQERR